MPPLCRTKHNRAKPLSEAASALFSIADAGEFRFARFYIVCEEVPLGTPESPPIVSGVPDMHPSDCPNVEETRNPMQTFSRKNAHIFLQRIFHLHFHQKSVGCASFHITSHFKRGCPFQATDPLFRFIGKCFLYSKKLI